MIEGICSVKGCNHLIASRNLCSTHYSRWRLHGDPLILLRPHKAPPTCSIQGCESPYVAKGYCSKHYQRWERSGNPHNAGGRQYPALEERFWKKVDKRGPDECWPWCAGKTKGGHGSFGLRPGIIRSAHRVAWELTYDRASGGLDLHHICENKLCVNPIHLLLLTRSEHARLHMRAHWARFNQAPGAQQDSEVQLPGLPE